MATVDDTSENRMICRKYCGACPTYRDNKLSESSPDLLFCARGISSASSEIKTARCYCPACELFTKHHLVIGYFCARQ
jgi:hypothetical protein